MNLYDFYNLKRSNINDVKNHFSDDLNNLRELNKVLLRYSLPFFDNEENDTIYLTKTPLKNEIIVWENNSSIILLFDAILTLFSQANYLGCKFLYRSIYEFLIINNHLILTNDSDYVNDWIMAKDVKIVKNILKRTNNKNKNELIEFWIHLSKHSHASIKTTKSGLDISETYGEHISNIWTTYILLYLYNYQLRELYFPYMQSIFKKLGVNSKLPYKNDLFKIKDKIRILERENNREKLFVFIDAFKFKWKLNK